MQDKVLTIALTLIGIAWSLPAAAAPGVNAFAGVIGGQGKPDISGGCTTFGTPEPIFSLFGATAFGVATGGISPCDYSGGFNNVVAASGPLTTSRSLAPVLLGHPAFAGTFDGTAQATADFKTLRAKAHGLMTSPGAGSSLALFESTSAAFFEDTLTASSPLIADLSNGFVRYRFQLDGSLSTPGVPAPNNQGNARAQLNIQHQGGGIYRMAQLDSTKGAIGTVASMDAVNPGWTAGVGSISGSGTFFSTIHGSFSDIDLPMNWDQPFDLKVGLMVWAYGTADADFFATAKLTGVQLFDASHNEVTDFVLSSAAGVAYAVPEPAAVTMIGAGLLVLAASIGLQRGSLHKT